MKYVLLYLDKLKNLNKEKNINSPDKSKLLKINLFLNNHTEKNNVNINKYSSNNYSNNNTYNQNYNK